MRLGERFLADLLPVGVLKVLGGVLFLTLSLPAQAWVQSVSSQGAGLHWNKLCPVIYAEEDGSRDVDDGSDIDAIQASLDTWNQVDCTAFRFVWGGVTNITWAGYSPGAENVNIVVFRDDHWPYAQRPVAFTSVTYDPKSGEVFDADIELNGEDFHFTSDPVAHPDQIDIQNTVTHEAGHIVGLGHSKKMDATMYDSAVFGETSKRTLSSDDEEAVCSLYPVGDSPTVCQEVEHLDLIVDNPDAPGLPPANPGCSSTAASGRAAGTGPTTLLLLLFLLVATLGRVCRLFGRTST